MKIVPNPFGGVNTHLWSKEAYVVGIVPVVRPAYSPRQKEWERNRMKGASLLGSVVRDRTWRATQQKLLNHDAEDGNISLTEEAQCGTDGVGVADDG